MADKADILLQMIQEQWSQARHSEDQRSTMTNYILIIAGAITAFLVDRNLDETALPLTFFLTALGILGITMSLKFRERFYFHIQRIHHMTLKLDKMYPSIKIFKLYKEADLEHHSKFPRLEPFPMYSLWLAIHIAIFVIGVVTTTIILIQ